MVNLAKETAQGGELRQPALTPANKMASDPSNSLFFSDVIATASMPTRRSRVNILDEDDVFLAPRADYVNLPVRRYMADIMAEDGVDELTAQDIMAEEVENYNNAVDALEKKSTALREEQAKVAQDALDAMTALATKMASHRVLWIRVSITSFSLLLASIVAYFVVGVV